MFGVHECGLVVDEDGRGQSLILHVQHHRQELVNHGHLHITTVIPGDQGLNRNNQITSVCPIVLVCPFIQQASIHTPHTYKIHNMALKVYSACTTCLNLYTCAKGHRSPITLDGKEPTVTTLRVASNESTQVLNPRHIRKLYYRWNLNITMIEKNALVHHLVHAIYVQQKLRKSKAVKMELYYINLAG